MLGAGSPADVRQDRTQARKHPAPEDA
jgi:hypothetical protein